MKSLLLALGVTLALTSCSNSDSDRPKNPGNLPPVGGQEPQTPAMLEPSSVKDKLKPVTDTGTLALKWINMVNEHRDLQNRLNLADTTTKNPVPPESPKYSSTELILSKYNERIAALPPEMRPYILENKQLTETPPISDELFLKHIRDLNGSYQNAVRWIGQQQWLDYYVQNEMYDIRGFYFFKKELNLENRLKDFANLDAETQEKFTSWLVSMCHNSEIEKPECLTELKKEIKKNQVLGFYNLYFTKSEKVYNEFFEVMPKRSDLTWNNDKSLITQQFVLPTLEKVATWLKTNIEEEWKATGFQLLLNFVPKNDFSPFIEFEKGVTPHVSGPTWNIITMDPDYSLDDYTTQWTIRHEFGHVLGFPDCYLEFFDTDRNEMAYYTIEPDNLMCAWGGKLQPSHIEQLKKAY